MLFLRAMGPYRAAKEARTQSEAARCFAALLTPPPPLADPLADLSLFASELVAIPSRWPCVQGNSVLERCLGLAPASLAAPVRRGKQAKLVRTVLLVIVAANEAAAKRMEHAIGTAGFRAGGGRRHQPWGVPMHSGEGSAHGPSRPAVTPRGVRFFLGPGAAGRCTAVDRPEH